MCQKNQNMLICIFAHFSVHGCTVIQNLYRAYTCMSRRLHHCAVAWPGRGGGWVNLRVSGYPQWGGREGEEGEKGETSFPTAAHAKKKKKQLGGSFSCNTVCNSRVFTAPSVSGLSPVCECWWKDRKTVTPPPPPPPFLSFLYPLAGSPHFWLNS